MGGDICAAIGFILEKFDNDIFRNRILTSEKLAHYSEPLVTYLQYNLNIFFDKLSNDLDALNSIIYYIWLECLAIIRYTAIGELEHKSKSCNYEHVNSYPFLEQTKQYLTSDMLHSISSPGRVFKGKINDRQIKYLSYVMEVLKELFNCGGSGIPYEKLEQKEFKEVRSILGHYPCDNRKLKVIYNHYMERNFSLYDHIWILNLLVAKGSSRFIRVKEYEMKAKLEKKLQGLNKKYQSSVSFYENHKRITSSSLAEPSKMSADMPLYDELDDELNSNVGSNVGSLMNSQVSTNVGSYASNVGSHVSANAASSSANVNNSAYNRNSLAQSSVINANENSKLIGYENNTNDNITNNMVADQGKLLSFTSENSTIKNEEKNMVSEYRPTEGRLSMYNSRKDMMNMNNGLIDRNSNNRFSSNRNIVTNSNRNLYMANSSRNLMVMQQNSSRNLMINQANGSRMMMNQINRNSMINMEMDMNINMNVNGNSGRSIYLTKNQSVIQCFEVGNGNGNGDMNVEVDVDRYFRNNANIDSGSSSSSLNRKRSDILVTYSNSFYLSNQTLNDNRNNEEFLREMMENFQKSSLTNLDMILNNKIPSSDLNNNDNNKSYFKLNEYNKNLDSRATLIDSNSNLNNDLSQKVSNEVLKNDVKRDSRLLKNSALNDTRVAQKMIPYVINHAQDKKVI